MLMLNYVLTYIVYLGPCTCFDRLSRREGQSSDDFATLSHHHAKYSWG